MQQLFYTYGSPQLLGQATSRVAASQPLKHSTQARCTPPATVLTQSNTTSALRWCLSSMSRPSPAISSNTAGRARQGSTQRQAAQHNPTRCVVEPCGDKPHIVRVNPECKSPRWTGTRHVRLPGYCDPLELSPLLQQGIWTPSQFTPKTATASRALTATTTTLTSAQQQPVAVCTAGAWECNAGGTATANTLST